MSNAILVMESRGLVPGSRSFTISDVWTRLYKTDAHFLDLSYEGAQGAERLMGQLLQSDGEQVSGGGTVVLRDAVNRELACADLGETGMFSLELGPEQTVSLSVELTQDSFSIGDFNLD